MYSFIHMFVCILTEFCAENYLAMGHGLRWRLTYTELGEAYPLVSKGLENHHVKSFIISFVLKGFLGIALNAY